MAKELKNCTKEELIYIIERLTHSDDYHLQRILGDMDYERVKRKLAEAERWAQIADDCLQKYINILKKYEGKKATDVPISAISEMDSILKEHDRANKKYDKLMKEVDAYGT